MAIVPAKPPINPHPNPLEKLMGVIRPVIRAFPCSVLSISVSLSFTADECFNEIQLLRHRSGEGAVSRLALDGGVTGFTEETGNC